MKMQVKIGDNVKLDMGEPSILNGRVYPVTDVIRFFLDPSEVISIEININGNTCPIAPEKCTVVS